MNEFQKQKLNPLIGLLAPGLASYEVEIWAKHRKLINPAFHTEKLKLMLPAFGESVTERINKWESKLRRGKKNILTSQGTDRAHTTSFTISLYTRMEVCATKTNWRMKEINSEIQKLLTEIIDKRKKAMEAGEVSKDDLLGIFMDSNFKATQSDENHKKQQLAMSFQHLIDECKLFHFAGQERTYVLLVWTMILLSKHQLDHKKKGLLFLVKIH
ncbi:hypothetical protein RDABS01_009539 [Bienertia sinuspersici]